MKRSIRFGVSVVATVALVSSMMAWPLSASAAENAGAAEGGNVSSSTNWEVPDSYMTNTVDVDGTTYKVITTWANAWALSGPDYLGVANSGTLNQNGGSGGSTDLETAQSYTLLGIWGSSVNEVPNAYNWNYFYNLALEEEGLDTDSSLAAVDVSNGASSNYDTTSGVYACFKYRPEIIWTSNSLSATQTATYVAEINSLSYYTDSSGEAVATGTDNDYYIDGDESYDPYVVSPSNSSPFAMLDSIYELAGYCEDVIEETADYNSDGAVTEDNVTWKTMNYLPRTTRYEASSENAVTAREAALDLEKVLKGSIYYTLAKIADGTVEEKKVAYICGTPDTTGSTCTVVDYEFTDRFSGSASTNGKVGNAAMVTEALTTDTVVVEGGSTGNNSTYSTYTATVDELLECDVIWQGNGSLTTAELTSWLSDNATTDEAKANIDSIEMVTEMPAIMNGHNHTAEKIIFSLYNISFIYPELYPNLELVTYWYDNVYHLQKDSLAICMQYGLGNATMPSGVEVSDLGDLTAYSADDIDAMALEGYEYYVDTLSSTDTWTSSTYSTALPSNTYAAWAEDPDGDWETIAELEDDLDDATADLEDANDTISDLEAQIEEIEAQIEELQEQISALEEAGYESVDELLAALEEALDALEEAEAALEDATSDTALEEAQDALAEAQATITNLTEQLATATSTAEASATELATAQETITSLTSQLTEAQTALAEAQAAASTSTSRAANTMTVKKATKTVKASKVKKKAITKKAITVSKAKGTVIYTKTGGSAKLTVNAKTGKIKVKKGTVKGTYKVKVKVTACGNAKYKAKSKTVTVKIKVK